MEAFTASVWLGNVNKSISHQMATAAIITNPTKNAAVIHPPHQRNI